MKIGDVIKGVAANWFGIVLRSDNEAVILELKGTKKYLDKIIGQMDKSYGMTQWNTKFHISNLKDASYLLGESIKNLENISGDGK